MASMTGVCLPSGGRAALGTSQHAGEPVMAQKAASTVAFPRAAAPCVRAAGVPGWVLLDPVCCGGAASGSAASPGQPCSKQLCWLRRERKPERLLHGAHRATVNGRGGEKKSEKQTVVW